MNDRQTQTERHRDKEMDDRHRQKDTETRKMNDRQTQT